MPPTPGGRYRGNRPQVTNQIGEIGRHTGIKPPKRVRRDSNGLENPEDFFAKAERSQQSDEQESSERSENDDDDNNDDDDEDGLRSIQQSNKKSNRGGASSNKKSVVPQRRHQERPDRFIVGQDRGRKTGIYKPEVPRDADGFEPIEGFFDSPSPTRSVATTAAQSTIRRTAQSNRTQYYDEDEEEEGEEVEDTSMMIDGDTTSLSPTTYQRTHIAASASASKNHKLSSLRQSTLPSGSHSVSRKGVKSNATSSPGTITDEEPSRSGGAKSIRRRLSSLTGDGEEGEEMQDEPVVEELLLGSDGRDDASGSGGEANTTIQGEVESEEEEEEEVGPRSNKSRKSIGKGKGRAVVSDDEQVEQEEDQEEERQASNSTSRKKGKPSRISEATSRGSPNDDESTSSPQVQNKKGKGKGKEVVRSPSPQNQEFDLSAFGGDQGGDYGGGFSDDDGGAGMGDYGSNEGDSPRPQIGNESGLVQDEQEEEEEEEEEDAQPVDSTSKAKGKGKGKEKEKEKAKGKGKGKKGKEPAVEKSPRRKKRVSDESNSSMETVTAKRARRATPSQERVIEEIPRDRQRVVGSVDDHGVRRSGRQRIEPLEYWRNERIIYRKRSSGVGMTAIVRVPKVEPEPLTTVGRKRAPRSKSAKPPSRTRARSVKEEPEVDEDEGVDDMTDPDGLVWSWEGNAETTRRICFTAKMMDPKATFNNQYLFQKIYQELDYLAGGILVIPVGGQKATKPAKDNSYIFFVTQGSVSVVCHRTRVSIGKDGSFFIPRGNSYSIEATSNKDVRLFFAQGRRVIELEDGSTRPDTIESSQQVLAFNAEGERLQSVVEEDEEEEEEEEEQGSGSEQQEEEEEEEE